MTTPITASPRKLPRRSEDGQQRTAATTASDTSSNTAPTPLGPNFSPRERESDADVDGRGAVTSTSSLALGGIKLINQYRPPDAAQPWMLGPLVKWNPEVVARFRHEVALDRKLLESEESVDDAPPLVDRHLAIAFARHQAKKSGRPVSTSKRLGASDLVYFGLIGVWPVERRFIVQAGARVEVLFVSVFQIVGDTVSPLGKASLYQKHLLGLPLERWSVGSIRRGRGYSFVSADDEVVQAALAVLPERGAR
jgi:hypothetical protein